MARKRALVVDDSKSARVILSRMLEKYDIEVDMAESAEQAIAYLDDNNRPDAIFMDHLMPGMDGLQALKAIKGNARTATIPIMMYTSQEGELYVGQARALGAMGVLPKQVRPVDVSKVLYELHLLPDRRDTSEPALQPVEIDGGSESVRPPRSAAGAQEIAPNAEWARRLESAIKEQAADLRRFVVTSLDGYAVRIVNDLRESMPPPELPPPPPSSAPRRVWPWAAATVTLALVAVVCAVLLALGRDEVAGVRAELAALSSANSELRRSGRELSATVKDLTAALAAGGANVFATSVSPQAGGAPVSTRTEPVPYGEIPFDRGRLEALREYLTRLEAQGFHGVVRATSESGQFCLSGNPIDGFTPANAALPVSKCDLIGNPFEESLSGQQRQSLAFANLVAGIRQRTGGSISVLVENAGTSRSPASYPPRTESLTAGEWNRAAAANNRVEFALEPTP
jgi:CheY-like chemotaxis protein